MSGGKSDGLSFARIDCATPNFSRQRNKSPVTTPYLRAAPETVAPDSPRSFATASFVRREEAMVRRGRRPRIVI